MARTSPLTCQRQTSALHELLRAMFKMEKFQPPDHRGMVFLTPPLHDVVFRETRKTRCRPAQGGRAERIRRRARALRHVAVLSSWDSVRQHGLTAQGCVFQPIRP